MGDNAPMNEEPGEPAAAQPATHRSSVVFPRGGISIRTHLWYQWAKAAIRQEERAWDSRRAAESDLESKGQHINVEMEEAMLGMTAVAHAFNALANKWRPLADRNLLDHELVDHLTSNRGAADRWREPLRDLFAVRDRAVHFIEASKPAVPHPLDTNVSFENETYSPENTTAAIDMMMDLLTTVAGEPSTELGSWAQDEGSLVTALAEFRAGG